MPGVPSAKVLADLEIGGRPKAPKVVGHLHGPVIGPEQVKHDGNPPPGDPGGLEQAEQLLEPDGQHRRTSRLVSELDAISGRNDEGLGCLLVQDSGLGVREPTAQERHKWNGSQLLL
jgi:hypothetical protein